MRAIPDYSLTAVLTAVREGRVTERGLAVIDRMTDEQIASCDIRAILMCVWLQHSETPVNEIPAEWWDDVMQGAFINGKARRENSAA